MLFTTTDAAAHAATDAATHSVTDAAAHAVTDAAAHATTDAAAHTVTDPAAHAATDTAHAVTDAEAHAVTEQRGPQSAALPEGLRLMASIASKAAYSHVSLSPSVPPKAGATTSLRQQINKRCK